MDQKKKHISLEHGSNIFCTYQILRFERIWGKQDTAFEMKNLDMILVVDLCYIIFSYTGTQYLTLKRKSTYTFGTSIVEMFFILY